MKISLPRLTYVIKLPPRIANVTSYHRTNGPTL